MLRPPNLFTVPGDPLAGYLLAAAAGVGEPVAAWRVVSAAAGCLLLYTSGLLQNDYFDMAEDRLQRPSRPLPSGRASPAAVVGVASVLAVLGVVLAATASSASGAAAAALAVAITAYNAGGKRIVLLGPVLMGACRGLSLLVGAGLAGKVGWLAPATMVSAAGLLVFIAAVTGIAARETQTLEIGPKRWSPAIAVFAWLAALQVMLPPAGGVAGCIRIGLAGWTILWMAHCGHRLQGRPEPRTVQRTIGQFIGGLLFVQAVLAVQGPPWGLVLAAGLLLAWPVSRQVAQRFYAS